MVDPLPSMSEAVGSSPYTTKRKQIYLNLNI
jgi:hypothetical protein